jgi:hypothetical protein
MIVRRNRIIFGLIALAGCVAVGFLLYADLRDWLSSPRKLAAESPVIVFARVDTNYAAPPAARLIVTEVWKDSGQSGASRITNGLTFTKPLVADRGHLPDGLVIFFQRKFSGQSGGTLEPRTEFYVWSGQIEGRSIQAFKDDCGL